MGRHSQAMNYNQHYENGATANKIPTSFKTETEKYPKTHMEPQKTPMAKTAPEQKRQCQRDYNSRLQNILQSHNHKNNMVLAENLRFHLTLVRSAKIN